jgi:Uncharacterized conserved protein
MRTLFLALLAVFILDASAASAAETGQEENSTNKRIVMKFENHEIHVAMNNSRASNDFIAMLPATLTFRDYNATEKVGDLPRKLSTSGSPVGFDPSVGDLTYYAPWGNLALFYKDFGYSNGLVSLGKLESGVETLATMRGEFQVRLEVAE